MLWQTAVDIARTCPDVTYEEWCALYVDPQHPTRQRDKASEAAHEILVRNNVIEESVRFNLSMRPEVVAR